MAPTERRRRGRSRATATVQADGLSHKEREHLRELEIRHGVIISPLDQGLVAKHWQTDEVVTEADDLREMEVVLQSMHIYFSEDGEA